MLQIEQIVLREILLPLREPFQISSGIVTKRRICVVEIRDQSGTTGWSECVAAEAPNYSPETIDTCWFAITEWIAPRVLNKKFENPGDIHRILEEDFRGHNMAKAAVEMGTWELAARMQNISLSKLLGGVREQIEVGISIGIQQEPATLVDKVQSSLAQGYRKVKVKIKPGKDLDYVRAIRNELGSNVPLMVDANNAYSINDFELFEQLDKFDLLMIEQPLAWDDLVRHAKLQEILKTPLCLDESITSLQKAEDMVTLGSGKIINIKPGRVGGFLSSIAIHNFAGSHNIPVWCGGMLESGIGRAHNVALASLPNFKFPGDISPSARYWERDIVTPEWTMDNQGRIDVPINEPGMGVKVDQDRIENLTVRSITLNGH